MLATTVQYNTVQNYTFTINLYIYYKFIESTVQYIYCGLVIVQLGFQLVRAALSLVIQF